MNGPHLAIRGAEPHQEKPMELGVTVLGDNPVAVAEAEFILAAFAELKEMKDAELKISVAMDRESGRPEVIYAGVQKKRSLETLRKVYRANREKR